MKPGDMVQIQRPFRLFERELEKKDFIGEYIQKIDFSKGTRGIYMVQIKTRKSFISKRLVLQ